MTDWKQWQGRAVGDNLPLTEYLAGTARSGVFLSVTDSQKVAIKLIPADTSSNARLDHWKLAESLSQSHLLKIHQSGRTTLDGVDLLYLVMEYADENLSQVLMQRALTNDEVREMLPPLLEALEFLHAKGFVHGGVKPGNIMAVGEQLKLASDDVMRAGDVVNSPGAYDAPEVRQGVSAASDVWSLGLTLVEVLTQQKPVSVEAALRRTETLAEPFRGIVQHSVQVNPSLRWKITDVKDSLAGKKIGAPTKPSPAKQPGPVHSKPNSVFSYGVPAVGLGVVVIGIIAAMLIPHHPKPEPTPDASVAVSTNAASYETPVPTPRSKPTATPETSSRAPEKTMPLRSGEDGVISRVLPDAPQKALNTITGKVRVKVRVKVDRQGNVIDSEFASSGPSRYFANLAMEAARKWKFAPADNDARAWNLQFEFRQSGAEAVPSRIER